MTNVTFVDILNRALNEPEFATLVVTNPSSALTQCDIEPTPDKVVALRAAADSLILAREVLDGIADRNV